MLAGTAGPSSPFIENVSRVVRFAQGLEATETAGPFSLLIENVTMVLSFAQRPEVTNISKHSHEQKSIEFFHKVSRVARVICLFNCGETQLLLHQGIQVQRKCQGHGAAKVRHAACPLVLESSHLC